MNEVINDKNMYDEIVTDLVEHYGWSEDKAKEWATQNGSSVVNAMWDAYSYYIEEEIAK